MKRMILVAVSILLALTLAAPTMALGQVGQKSKPSGQTGQLVAAWWQWALEEPAGETPLEGSYDESVEPGDTQCDGSNSSGTWFLAGAISGDKIERTCTVPADTQLFFPVFNNIFILFEGETEQDARDYLNSYMDSVLNDPAFTYTVTVDGKEVQSNRIVRADSALFTLDLPENNLVGLEAGEWQAVGRDERWRLHAEHHLLLDGGIVSERHNTQAGYSSAKGRGALTPALFILEFPRIPLLRL
jgi:hypothetical protein